MIFTFVVVGSPFLLWGLCDDMIGMMCKHYQNQLNLTQAQSTMESVLFDTASLHACGVVDADLSWSAMGLATVVKFMQEVLVNSKVVGYALSISFVDEKLINVRICESKLIKSLFIV